MSYQSKEAKNFMLQILSVYKVKFLKLIAILNILASISKKVMLQI